MSEDIISKYSTLKPVQETAINPGELPKAVKIALLYDLYEDLKVASVVLVKGEVEYFLIELIKDDEVQFIKLKLDGQKIT